MKLTISSKLAFKRRKVCDLPAGVYSGTLHLPSSYHVGPFWIAETAKHRVVCQISTMQLWMISVNDLHTSITDCETLHVEITE